MRTMNKYLFYCTEIYCLSVLRPLQKVIRKRGGRVAWFFDKPDSGASLLFDDEELIDDIQGVKKFNPAAVFTPVDRIPDFFPGIKVEIFHGLANDLVGKKGHFKDRGFFDLYCTRAPEETRLFEEIKRGKGHFEVIETGWPKVDPLFSGAEDNNLQKTLKTSKPIVFFASTFSPSLTQAPELVDTIRQLSLNGKYHWIVTLHPKTDEQIVAKYRALQGENLSYFESSHDVIPLLQAGNVMLCDTSSISIEFMMLDKPVVTFKTKVPGPHVIDVRHPQEIDSALDRAMQRPPDLLSEARKFIDRLHPYRDGNSSERVLNAVNVLIHNGIDHLRLKPRNLFRKYKIRKKLKYYSFK